MVRFKTAAFSMLIALFPFLNVHACDFCATYYALGAKPGDNPENTLQIGAANRFAYYSAPANRFAKSEHLASTQSQFFASYQASEQLAVHVSVPYIYRRYKRSFQGTEETGEEYGLADSTLTLQYVPYRFLEDTQTFIWGLRGGLKLPTGDSDRLEEERLGRILRHGGVNGQRLGGEDLALGSGSFDVPLGSRLLYQVQRFRILLDVDYIIRTEGDYDYQYGNDFVVASTLSYFPILDDGYTFEVGLRSSGEFKANDSIQSETIERSNTDYIFLGPMLAVTFDQSLYLASNFDFVLKNGDSSNALTPDYRIGFQFAYTF